LAEIAVTWIGEGPEPHALMRVAAAHVQDVFGARAAVVGGMDPPADVLDPRRGQHSSTAILHWLAPRLDTRPRLLAVTDADLFIPVLTFVYGEAQLGGRTAVVSLFRLRDPREAGRTAARLGKEAAHEVGHLFGLVHCPRPGCVMQRSASLHDVDAKGDRLCPDCRLRLQQAVRTDLTTREAL
jgi:archaemetzincin